MKPLAIDLFCGLGGWTTGLIAEGWHVVGFDIERHEYGDDKYPGQLVLQDVLTIHGSQFKDAHLIVASPPCQQYSYRAMPWSRAKALPPPDNNLFDACFRIQREACEAAGRHIPLVVENVRGAQKWVGRAAWNFGSFYLWGDVPALMPTPKRGMRKTPVGSLDTTRKNYNPDHSWNTEGVKVGAHINKRDGHAHTPHLTNRAEHEAVKQPGLSGVRANGKGDAWFQDGAARHGSKSSSRKAASAQIAKIPFVLAQHIARVYFVHAEDKP